MRKARGKYFRDSYDVVVMNKGYGRGRWSKVSGLSTTQNQEAMSYRIRSWSKYNAGLKQRGSLTFWLSDDLIDQWVVAEKSGKHGASTTYSDIAIATFETLKCVYGLAGRQTEGFLASLFELMNVELSVPEHSTVSRRKRTLSIALPVVPQSSAVHLVVDSTGIKVYGEKGSGKHGNTA